MPSPIVLRSPTALQLRQAMARRPGRPIRVYGTWEEAGEGREIGEDCSCSAVLTPGGKLRIDCGSEGTVLVALGAGSRLVVLVDAT